MTRLSVPLLLSASLIALGVAWLMSTPPGSAPDENAHYVKALGAGGGDLRGQPAVSGAEQRRALIGRDRRSAEALRRLRRATDTAAVRWQARTRRRFELPRELVASTFGCTTTSRETTGACTNKRQAPVTSNMVPSYVGTYQPYVYVPIGAAMRLAGEPHHALRLGRAVTLLACVLLLLAALWLLWSPRAPATSLLGFAVAVSPMVLFVSSVLSTSGPEVAGAICFSAALLRLARDEPPPRGVWVAVAASGGVLAGSRALGPAFAGLLFGAIPLLAGPRRFLQRVRKGSAPMFALIVAAVVGAAGAFWEFTFQPLPAPSSSNVVNAVAPAVVHLPLLGRQAIGIFGAADAEMPWPGYALWLAALLVLGGTAVAWGQRRDRLSALGLALGLLIVVIGMSLVYREIGRLQGRYVLPLLVLLPLWLGETALAGRARVSASAARAPAAVVLGLVAVVQAVAWLANAHRFSVGEGGAWTFLAGGGWSPSGGWAPWALLAFAGVMSWLASGALAATRRDLV